MMLAFATLGTKCALQTDYKADARRAQAIPSSLVRNCINWMMNETAWHSSEFC